jgi:CheY-like chemotaxis protein
VTGLPEPHVYDPNIVTREKSNNRVRSFYVNTLLPAAALDHVQLMLQEAELTPVCTAVMHSDMVAITGPDGALFGDSDHAEEIRLQLIRTAPEMFEQSVVAFTNIEVRDSQLVHELRPADKTLLLLVTSLEERKLIYNLCVELKITVEVAASAVEALTRLEDGAVDLLIMDLQLPDMHSWEMIGKLREVEALRQLPIILIADHAMPEDASLTVAVANVDVYLERPLSKARLRQNIWMALHGQ